MALPPNYQLLIQVLGCEMWDLRPEISDFGLGIWNQMVTPTFSIAHLISHIVYLTSLCALRYALCGLLRCPVGTLHHIPLTLHNLAL